MQKWFEIRIIMPTGVLPRAETILIDNKIESWIESEEPEGRCLTFYLPSCDDIEEKLNEFRDMAEEKTIELIIKEIEDQNWAESWRKDFAVERVGERFVLKPPWLAYEKKPDDIVIEIEPRMAFGTGYHPTTKGTLLLLEKYMKPGMSVMDMGCGSGILSIAASRLGAKTIRGYDYDNICIRESEENYDLCKKKHPEMTDDAFFIFSNGFENGGEPCDMLMVNIIPEFLLKNAEKIGRFTNRDGVFITGSINGENEKGIIEGLQRYGMSLLEKEEEEGWIRASFIKG